MQEEYGKQYDEFCIPSRVFIDIVLYMLVGYFFVVWKERRKS
jgi:hypothetical protein